VVFRLHEQEGYIASDAAGFPVERQWARDHPECFEPLARGRAVEIYGFRSR